MKKKWLNPSVQEGALFLILSGWLLTYSMDKFGRSLKRDWTQSPGLFPVMISALIALLALCLLWQGMRETGGESVGENGGEKKRGGHAVQVAILLGMSVLYYAVLAVVRMPYLGVTIASMTLRISTFEVATAVFLAAMMRYLGVRKWQTLVCVPLGASAFLSVMFRTLLRVLLP